MALQLLPILLLGGGAAYVYSKQKAKARKRSGLDCPTENTVTLSDSVAAGQQAAAKYGESSDPFKEAEYYIRTLLPETCNKKSKSSRVKMSFSLAGENVDLSLSVPDLYMLGIIGATDRRLGTGKLTQEQAQKVKTKALEWYKQTTGKPFDPASLGLEKFAVAFAVAMKDALEKALKGGEGGFVPGPSNICPDRLVIDLSDADRANLAAKMSELIASGERSPFPIADVAFQMTMPQQCRRNDFKTVVEVRHNGELFQTYNAASYFAALVLETMEEMVEQGTMTQETAQQVFNDIKASYKGLTGQELPPNLN